MQTKDWVLCCMMAGLTAVMALFPPITLSFLSTPITLQTLGVMLAGSLLGAKRAGLALLLFLLMVVLGFPVLSGLVGGVGAFLMPSGGFLSAWPLSAFVIGWLAEKFWQRLNFFSLGVSNFFGGVVVMYAVGIPWMSYFAQLSLVKAFYLSLVFIPGDLLKIAIATWVGMTFKKYYPLVTMANKERCLT